MHLLTFCKRKGESFYSPLRFPTTSTETSAKPPTSLLMIAVKPWAAKSSIRFTARSAQPFNPIIRTTLNLIRFTALQVQVEEAAIQNAHLTATRKQLLREGESLQNGFLIH